MNYPSTSQPNPLGDKLENDKVLDQLMGGAILAEEERNAALATARAAFIRRDRESWMHWTAMYYQRSKEVLDKSEKLDFYVRMVWEALDMEAQPPEMPKGTA